MKTTILSIALFACMTLSAQVDTVARQQIQNIKMNLEKCHIQHQDGAGLFIGGLSLSVLDTTVNMISIVDDGVSYPGLVAVSAISGLAAVVGSFVMIDSHRFIGKAGATKFGVGVTFEF